MHDMLDDTRHTFRASIANGDYKLLERLGLKTDAAGADEFVDIGTVTLEADVENETPAPTIRVEVASAPAQFWRFTITRPRESARWPLEEIVLETGSGGFGTYYPLAETIASGMVDVGRPRKLRGSPA